MVRQGFHGLLLLLLTAALARAQAPTTVTVARPIVRESADFDFNGRLESAEVVTLRSTVAGKVKKLRVKPGDSVQAGDILVELSAAEVDSIVEQTAANVKKTQAKFDKAAADLRRLKTSNPPATDAQIAIAEAESDVAAAELKLAQQALAAAEKDRERTIVKAPFSGLAREVNVKEGDEIRVAPGARPPLATIISVDPVLVDFAVDERTLLYIKKLKQAGEQADDAVCPVTLALPGEQEFSHQGRVEPADNRIDPETGLIHFLAEFDNRAGKLTKTLLGAKPSQRSVTLRLTLGKPHKLMLTLASAVGFNATGEAFVLVAGKGNVVESRPVKLGPRIGAWQAIEQGIAADDSIIIGKERERARHGAEELRPDDFAADLRLLRLRPGSPIAPVHVELTK